MTPKSLLLAFLALSLAACRHGALREGGVFEKDEVSYKLGPLPQSFEQVRLHGVDVAFTSKRSPHVIAVNSTCEDHGDPPLGVLTRHLLMGFTDRQLVSEEERMLDGRAVLRSHYVARLDGVPEELLLLVMKKNTCVFDFSYLSPQGRLNELLGEFEALVAGFHTLETPQ
jgi:hypothetical protein